MLAYLPRFQQLPAWRRTVVIPGFGTMFIVLFFALYPIMGGVAWVLSFIPVAAIAWPMGKLAGLISGTAMVLINYVLLALAGADASSVLFRGVLSSLTLILLGGLAGWVSELVEKLRTSTTRLESDHRALAGVGSHLQSATADDATWADRSGIVGLVLGK